MPRPDKYDITSIVRQLIGLLRQADDETLNAAYQSIAREANESDFAADLEPLQNICGAFTAETKRRAWEAQS
jgi:hypothetical protein